MFIGPPRRDGPPPDQAPPTWTGGVTLDVPGGVVEPLGYRDGKSLRLVGYLWLGSVGSLGDGDTLVGRSPSEGGRETEGRGPVVLAGEDSGPSG